MLITRLDNSTDDIAKDDEETDLVVEILTIGSKTRPAENEAERSMIVQPSQTRIGWIGAGVMGPCAGISSARIRRHGV